MRAAGVFIPERVGRTMRLIVLGMLAVILSAPLAAAASVQGELHFPRGADVRAPLTIEASSGALDVSAARPVLRFERAEGWIVTRSWEFIGPPGGAQVFLREGSPENASIDLGAGSLAGLACAPERCRALLLAEGAGTVAMDGNADGPLRWRAEPDAWSATVNGTAADNFYYATPAGWLAASTASRGDATTLTAAHAKASGALTLFLANASLEATTSDGTMRLDATPRDEPTSTGPLGVPTGSRTVSRFIVLHLTGAELVDAPGGLALVAPAPILSMTGTFLADAAQGRLVVDGQARELRGESLRLDGAITLAPRTDAPLLAPVAAHTLASTFDGEADVRIAGEPAGAPRASSLALAAGATGLALLIALGLLFYTRLERGSLLDNPRRRAIHDALRARPGSTAADLVRATGVAEVVVRHHLRMLEEHQLVVLRGEGKLRAYFALDGATDAGTMGLHVALKDPTRRRVAEAVAWAVAPASQKDLVANLQISQRLVSYHLTKLEEQKLISGTGAMPRRYVANAALCDFLAPTEGVAA